jgi:hypothetical protein
MLLEKLVEQHCVHRVVSHSVKFSIIVAHDQVRIYLSHLLRDQSELPRVRVVTLVLEDNWLKRKNGFAGPIHRFNLFLEPPRGARRAELARGRPMTAEASEAGLNHSRLGKSKANMYLVGTRLKARVGGIVLGTKRVATAQRCGRR